MKRHSLIAVVAFLVCVSALVVAQTLPASHGPPLTLPYSGVLEHGGGAVDGERTLTFFLVEDESDTLADALWTETRNVTLHAGRFSVVLGEVTAFDSDTFARGSLYLGVEIDGAELDGKQRLGRTPYSIEAVAGVPVGTIVAFGGETPPDGWLLCNGAEYDDADYPRLASTLGAAYQQGARFRVPDLRSRYATGAGGGVALGAVVGHNTVAHAHTSGSLGAHVAFTWTNATANQIVVESMAGEGFGASTRMNGQMYQADTVGLGGPRARVSGSTASASHDNRPESVGLNYIIKW